MWLAGLLSYGKQMEGTRMEAGRRGRRLLLFLQVLTVEMDGNKAIEVRFVLEIETSFADGIRCVGEGTERSDFWLEQLGDGGDQRVGRRTGLGRKIKSMVWDMGLKCFDVPWAMSSGGLDLWSVQLEDRLGWKGHGGGTAH